MKNLVSYKIFEELNTVESLLPAYHASTDDLQEIGSIYGVRVISVNRDAIKAEYPEWETYIGSHHWGKKSQYIDPDSIWIAQNLPEDEFIRVVNHELIEREMMRALQQNQGMTPEESWSIAHPTVRSLGF